MMFCRPIERLLSDDDWRLASLGITAGGLGAKCAAEHAPAAYVASLFACRYLCGLLWADFGPLTLTMVPPCCYRELPSERVSSGANINAESDPPFAEVSVVHNRGPVSVWHFC